MNNELYPCPGCGRPYSYVDPMLWHVDPRLCRHCRPWRFSWRRVRALIKRIARRLFGETRGSSGVE